MWWHMPVIPPPREIETGGALLHSTYAINLVRIGLKIKKKLKRMDKYPSSGVLLDLILSTKTIAKMYQPTHLPVHPVKMHCGHVMIVS